MNNQYLPHECQYIPENGVYIEYIEGELPSCTLFIQREATEADIEKNSYLEILGETIWTTEIEIVFCPYCGKRLVKTENTCQENYGNFRHIDCSGWDTKIV